MDKKLIKTFYDLLDLFIINFVVISFMLRVQVLMDTIVAVKIECVMAF